MKQLNWSRFMSIKIIQVCIINATKAGSSEIPNERKIVFPQKIVEKINLRLQEE